MRGFWLAILVLAACGETTYEFEPTGAGGDETRAPRAKSDSQYVRSIYADLVGRAPTSYEFHLENAQGVDLFTFPVNEQAILLGALDGVGDATPLRALIVAGLVRSAEVDLPEKADVDDPAAWIAGEFRTLLGREPNPYELGAFVDAWHDDDAVGPRTVVRALLGSREYQSF
jgi:hypothetical protein